MKAKHVIFKALGLAITILAGFALPVVAQDSLPFPEPPSASKSGKTLADSEHKWRKAESHLPADAPNIVIFMTDDAGFSNPSTFGGPIHMPTMDRLAPCVPRPAARRLCESLTVFSRSVQEFTVERYPDALALYCEDDRHSNRSVGFDWDSSRSHLPHDFRELLLFHEPAPF